MDAVSGTVAISVSEAKAQLAELVRRAEAGEDVLLTRHGQPTVRLVPVQRALTPEKRAAMERLVGSSCGSGTRTLCGQEPGLPV